MQPLSPDRNSVRQLTDMVNFPPSPPYPLPSFHFNTSTLSSALNLLNHFLPLFFRALMKATPPMRW